MSLQLGQTFFAQSGAVNAHVLTLTAEDVAAIVVDRPANQEDAAGPSATIVAVGAINGLHGVFPYAVHELPEFDLDALVQRLVAAFRCHPHINNVMTHICGGRWERIGQALGVILDPGATRDNLSPLTQNVVELMWAERGITGRILKPYLCELFAKTLPKHVAEQLSSHIAGLSLAVRTRVVTVSPDTVEPRAYAVAPRKG